MLTKNIIYKIPKKLFNTIYNSSTYNFNYYSTFSKIKKMSKPNVIFVLGGPGAGKV